MLYSIPGDVYCQSSSELVKCFTRNNGDGYMTDCCVKIVDKNDNQSLKKNNFSGNTIVGSESTKNLNRPCNILSYDTILYCYIFIESESRTGCVCKLVC